MSEQSIVITKEEAGEIWPALNRAISELPLFYDRLDLVILQYARSLVEILATSLSESDRDRATVQLVPTRLAIQRCVNSLAGKTQPSFEILVKVSRFADRLEHLGNIR